ncbi:MAG: class I SAM-dependent methyltransferase [Chitinophagaceae bacterium]
MKVRNPKSRNDLSIRRSDYVLEIGGGHNPHFRSNVVVDKFADSNDHRSGDLKLLKGQKFIEADGQNLPFKDKEFDFVICNQVLEHVDDPSAFLKEQFRVARRGYIETPSVIGEYMFPKQSHLWLLHEYQGKVYMVNKSQLPFVHGYDLGELFQEYLPTHSIGFKVLERTHPNLFTLRIEWENDFDFEINPTSPEILQYFSGQWKKEWADDFFPTKSLAREFLDAVVSYKNIALSTIRSKMMK